MRLGQAKDRIKTILLDIIAQDQDQSMLEYVLMMVLFSYLHHSNKEELVYFWEGEGRNGKRVIAKHWGELNIDR